MWGSLPFVLERNAILNSSSLLGRTLSPAMGTAEEDSLGAGAAPVLEPLAGLSAIPSHAHLSSHSCSSSAPN